MFRRILPACCLLLLGCGSPASPVRSNASAPVAKEGAGTVEKLGTALPAFELARVEPGTYGPVSVSLEAGTLAVWAVPRQRGRTWHARAIDRDGRASTPPRIINETSLELGLVSLTAVVQGLNGLLVYSLQPAEQSTTLHALLLDSSGAPKSSVAPLTKLNSTLLWTQAIDTAAGPIVFYAIARGDRAEIRAVGLAPDGKIRFVDRPVVSDLRAWQIVSAPDGATLAVIRATGQPHGGTVSLYLLDQLAGISAGPIDLDPRPSTEADLDLTRVGKNYIVAWSSRAAIDSRIYTAAVDPSGTLISAARPALPSHGEQVLIKLVPPVKQGRAVMVWENASLPSQRRMLSLAEVDDRANVQSSIVHLACSSRSNVLPEIIATTDGISALTFDDSDESSATKTLDPMPTYVEFDTGLVPRAAVPLVLEVTKDRTAVPLLAWGLDCRHGCRAMGALDDSPVTIATVPLSDIGKRPNAQELARRVTATQPTAGLRVESLESLAELEPVADLAAIPANDGFLVTTVTYFDPTTPLKRLAKPGPDGRTEPLQARLDVLPLASNRDATPTPVPLSYRANSLPGLSLSASKSKTAGYGVAWSAIDQGQPQVFMSTVGEDGKKLQQRMLTHKRGRLGDLALTAHEDGWLLAWMDERTEQPNLYAISLSPSLERRGTEQRLTTARLDASDLSLALVPLQSEAVLVYAVSRRAGRNRSVELYTRRVSKRDAQPMGMEQRVLELPGPVKFLSAVPHEDGIVVGWIEVPADADLADKNAKVRWVRLDGSGAAVTQPSTLTIPDAVPAAMAIECPGERCHGIVTVDVGGRGELQAFTFHPRAAETIPTIPLTRSLGTAEQNVAPVLSGEHVFMIDQIDAERTRVVHAKLRWE